MWRTSISALVAALAVAACGSSQTGTSSSSSVPSTSSARTTPQAAAATAACSPTQLRLRYVGTQGATGHLEVTLALRNASQRTCTLQGYPGARLLGAGGAPLPLKVKRGGGFFPDSQRPARPVTLKPGGRARFGVSFVTNNEFAGAQVCRNASAAMSSAPGSGGHWWRLSLHGAPTIAPCGSQLVVSPLYA